MQTFLFYLLIWDSNNFSKLYHHAKLNAIFDEKKKSIKLLDVIVEEEYKRQGFGQKAVQVLIDLSVKKNFNKIFGELAESDLIDHKDVLVAFYKKLGFNIWLNSDNKYGELEKKLKV